MGLPLAVTDRMTKTMASKRQNGNLSLTAALAQMLQNQARFVSHLDEDRQRFRRIERDLDLIKALLVQHQEALTKMSDTIRDKIGFKR